MKLKNIITILMTASMLSLVSCEDGLDIQKHGNMGSQDDFYKTDQDAEQAVASMYTSLQGLHFNWSFLLNMLSDDIYAGGGNRGDNADLERLNEYTFDTDHGTISGTYQGLYSLIYKANIIIAKVTPDTEVRKQAVAEAYFFRGWANFNLASLWGTAPNVDHLLSPSEYHQGNSEPGELIGQAEQDFRTAMEGHFLPSKSNANDEMGAIRVTHEVAQAMLGKTLLWEGQYKEAAAELDQVIASKKYDLYQGDYDLLGHAATNNCCEAMLEVQFRKDPEQAWARFDMNYIMRGWRTELLNLGSLSSTISMGTYGFCNPRKSLYDAFVATEGENGYRLRSTIRTYQSLNEEYGLQLQAGKTLVGHEGYFNWKERALQDDNIMDASYFQVMQYTNRRIMRYAEVLLLAAEAHVMAGDGKAAECINPIRTRAHLAPLSAVTLEDVKNEKRLELCMEDVRFQDLVRWGDADKFLANQGKQVPSFTANGVNPTAFTNTTYGFKNKHNLLPFPRKEMELNKSMHQNIDW